MTSRPLILCALLTCAVPPCAAPPPPVLSPPGVCLRISADQLIALALAIAADGHTVETPCLEVVP